MLFTGKGDDGKTNLYPATAGQAGRVSKSSKIAWALGSVDELNSWLGLCRARIGETSHKLSERHFSEIILEVQQNLFIVQAELAGAEKSIVAEKVKAMEKLIREIEDLIPAITSFSIPGATEVSALFDYARTLARRAERSAVDLATGSPEPGSKRPGRWTLAYLNRLSSLLFALSRLAAHQSGVKEEGPSYK